MSKKGWSFEVMKDEMAYLSPEQVDMLISKINIQPYNLIVRLLWKTGARITEVLNIKLIDIDFTQKEINLKTLKQRRKDKTRPPRKVPLNDESLLHDLANYTKDMFQRDLIFKNTNRFKVYYRIRKAAKEIGLEELGERSFMHPHILRHSFAIHWVKQGLPLSVLSKILGHSSMQTTDFYQKFNTKDVHEFIKKMWEK